MDQKHEDPDASVEIIVEQDCSMAEYLPEDHSMNDAACECEACTYPLS